MIADRELIADEHPSAGAIERALDGRFTLGPAETTMADLVYYDTFDALLRQAGRTLMWPAGEPFDTAIAARGVEDVIGVRALLPQARVTTATDTIALLDDLQKTVARVAVHSPAVAIPGRGERLLAPRLQVIAVRGYDRAARTAFELLTASLPVRPADVPLHDEAVAAAGGDPVGVSAKVDVDLGLAERADVAAVRVLRRLIEVIDANLPGTLADTDSEFLHDYRVAVRRTRAVLRELRHAFLPADLERFRGDFRWLQQITGESRDLDVYVIGFDELSAFVPEAVRGDLQPLLGVLERRRLAAHRTMVRELRGDRAATLRSDWAGLLAGLTELPLDDRPDAARPIGELSSERIRKVYRRMVRMGDAIGSESPPEDYHELRKKGKELRYMLELFGAPLHDPAVVKPLIRALKDLQDVLGRHQDREVQVGSLRSLSEEVASLPGGPEALLAMGVLIERLDADAAAARSVFAASFTEFASSAQRKLVRETFAR